MRRISQRATMCHNHKKVYKLFEGYITFKIMCGNIKLLRTPTTYGYIDAKLKYLLNVYHFFLNF